MFRRAKHGVWLFLCWFVLAGQVWAMPCDVDNDGDIDRDDLNLIQKAILARAPVSGPDDPRDPDRNGVINSIDGRLCALRCTRAQCGTVNQAPFANAGPDQSVKVGDLVRLTGLSKRGIQNVIAELQAKSVITIHQAPGYHRSQTTVYEVPAEQTILDRWFTKGLRYASGKSKNLVTIATVE